MNPKRPKLPPTNRMFRSIVVMGSGLALSCGGVAQIDGGNGGAPSGSAPGGNSGGASGAPQPTQIGGSSAVSAGYMGSGGSPSISVGGGLQLPGQTAGAAGMGAVANPSCPFSQWDCTNSATEGYCSYGTTYGVQIGTDCFCNPNRPASGADCKPGNTYACRLGVLSSTSDSATPFECSCTPTPPDGSSCDICSTTYGVYDNCTSDTPNDVLCGCAIVLLK